MEKCLLSIDWDYFVYTSKGLCGSYIENNRSLIDLWYKRYLQEKERGRDIRQSYRLSPELDTFWERIKERFQYAGDIKAYVSDSHAVSYDIAKENNCETVFLLDSHADLGYGGLSSLNFEVNCSNWLGKLLKDKLINEAVIVYSPYTVEKPEHFIAINNTYNIKYRCLDDLAGGIEVSAIHVCRSGAWTPPWLDDKFNEFILAMEVPYIIENCPERKWDTEHISFSDCINYLMA